MRPKTSGLNRVSTANEELIDLPQEWDVREYKAITFYAAQDCTLIWNNDVELPIMASSGMVLDEKFKPIKSLKIKESGIPFFYIAGY